MVRNLVLWCLARRVKYQELIKNPLQIIRMLITFNVGIMEDVGV